MSLEDQEIFLNAPCNFNDPYDFAPNFRLSRPSKGDIDKSHEIIQKQNPQDKLTIIPEYQGQKGIERLSDQLFNEMYEPLKESILRSAKKGGVSCFSESNDIILQWSHYADHHKGFCLEFDTKETPFSKVCKVDYVTEFPEINPLFIYEEDRINTYINLLKIKFIDWSYEREWRIIGPSAGTKLKYSPKALNAVYFGTKIDSQDMERISDIVRSHNENVQLYKGLMNETRFHIDFEKIDI
tara:strand:+ start:17093 stop:17812 length:720 start_codon:yes stop_codon:yes gene_type:complete